MVYVTGEGNAVIGEFLSRKMLFAGASMLAISVICGPAKAITLNEAIDIAIESNPEIGQAVENREAIEFELRQARGLYLPSIDLEGSVGARRLDNPSRRLGGIEDDDLYPAEIGLVVTQKLFDSGARRAELERQASRVDGASFRVLERSEFIALQAVREYLEYVLQARIVGLTQSNLTFHRGILGEIEQAISGGALTEADRQQARERVFAAEARVREAQEELEAAGIRFYTLVGKPIGDARRPGSVAGLLPQSLDVAIGTARKNNPRIRIANADIDAADALVDAARSKFGPEVLAEARARVGDDLDGASGFSEDFQVRIVARWNLYRGGIDQANEQEQVRRASEQRLVLHQVHREVEEAVRISWDRRFRQADLAELLRSQSAANASLVTSYQEQFRVGQRSLLDVLDAQNTRFNTAILAETAEYAALFSEYRLLASTGQLVSAMGAAPPQQAEAYARDEFDVPATRETETYARSPSRQVNTLPLDLLAPMR